MTILFCNNFQDTRDLKSDTDKLIDRDVLSTNKKKVGKTLFTYALD